MGTAQPLSYRCSHSPLAVVVEFPELPESERKDPHHLLLAVSFFTSASHTYSRPRNIPVLGTLSFRR